MKKFFLLVASVLTAIQSFANRGVGANSNSLILSSSDGIYNHGSHASHSSHRSHYSMTKVEVKNDSIRSLTQEERKTVVHSLAIMHNCKDNEVEIIGLYISRNIVVTAYGFGSYKPNPLKKCLHASFRIWDYSQYPASYSFIQEYIIPLSRTDPNYYIIGEYKFNEKKKEEWMIDFANKNN